MNISMHHQLRIFLISLAFGVLNSASAQDHPSGDDSVLVCKKGDFNLILDPLDRKVGQIAILSIWAKKEDDRMGLGRISESSDNGDFVSEFPLDENLRIPTSGPTTTVRYIKKDRLAIVLVTPVGLNAGYHISATCVERPRQRRPGS